MESKENKSKEVWIKLIISTYKNSNCFKINVADHKTIHYDEDEEGNYKIGIRD